MLEGTPEWFIRRGTQPGGRKILKPGLVSILREATKKNTGEEKGFTGGKNSSRTKGAKVCRWGILTNSTTYI